MLFNCRLQDIFKWVLLKFVEL